MTLVRVIKDWDTPDLIQQTPSHSGVWDGIEFTVEPVERCDYVVVCNRVPGAATVQCPPGHIWAITQEPPVKEYRWLRQGFASFARIYTQDASLRGEKYIHSQPALPWHVRRDYDFLKAVPPPEKTHVLSWVTSNATGRRGHRARMAFLEQLRQRVAFDLWGRGFTAVEDKWDGLAPYRYALAVENHRSPYYWTEKLADCLLSWTLPIYGGCTNITDYFPAEALVQIDITRPQEAIAIIEETIQGDLWLRRRDAIAHARELVLDRHQFFPFFAAQIREFEQRTPTDQRACETIHLPRLPYLYPQPQPWSNRLRQGARRGLVKITSLGRRLRHG